MAISDRLDQIEKRTNAATEGPWEVMEEVDGVRAGRRTAIRAQGNLAIARRVVTVDQTRPHHEPAEANVEFIAHARTDVPELVEAVRRRDAALRAVLDVLGPHYDSQVKRNAKLGRTGSDCVCDGCNAVRAVTAALGEA